MSKPNLNMAGRMAGSPDNAQGTHFFLINDSGTYFLRKLLPAGDGASPLDLEVLIARANQVKVRVAGPSHRRAGREPGLPAYSTPTGSRRTFPGRPSCSRSSTCPGSTSTA